MKPNAVIIIIVLVLVASCKNENNTNIRNDNIETISFYKNYQEKLPYSSFVDTIELIPLETTEKSLIGEITRVVFDDNKYYVRSTNGMQNAKLYVFDDAGKYLKQIGEKGNGPGEYILFKDFSINSNHDIIIADAQKFLVYDEDGVFSYAISLDTFFSAKEIVCTTTNDILALYASPDLFDNNMLSIVSREGVERNFFNRGKIEAIRCGLLNNWRSLVSTDTCYYLNYAYCDTIFAISQDFKDFSAKYSIDYGKNKLSNIEVHPNEDVSTWRKKLSAVDNYLNAISIGIGDYYLYIGTTNKTYDGYLTLYSLKNKKSITARKLIDDMYLKDMLVPITAKRIPQNMDDNDIIWAIESTILIDGFKQYWSNLSAPRREAFKRDYAEWYRICTSLKEDDNPVLMRIRVKDF